MTHCPDCGEERYCKNPRILDPATAGLPDDQKKFLPCRFHGGHSHKNRGAAHGAFKGGKYSKYLPARLLEAYDASRDDTEILSLNDDIALTESRITDVLTRVDANESGAIWDELTKTSQDFKAARRAGDTERVGQLLEDMLKLITKGKGDRENWREIGDLMERKRKLSESQLKLLVTKQEFISRQQAVSMVSLITQAIKENVENPNERRKVALAIQSLMSLNEGQRPADTHGLKNLGK